MPTQPQALPEQFSANSTDQLQCSKFATFVTTASSSKFSWASLTQVDVVDLYLCILPLVQHYNTFQLQFKIFCWIF